VSIRGWQGGLTLLLAALASSCSPTRSHEPHTTPASPHTTPVVASPAPAEADDCSVVRRGPPPAQFAEKETLRASVNLALALDQPVPAVPPVWTDFRALRSGWQVRAFAHDFAPNDRLGLGGCSGAVGKDGRYCPTTVIPGAELSADQVKRLVGLLVLPPSKGHVRCYDPHHSFVLFDARGIPRAELTVCFECGNWALNDGRIISFPEGKAEDLGALCWELGLGGCPALRDDSVVVTEEESSPEEVALEAKYKAQEEADDALDNTYRAWQRSGAPAPLWTRTSAKPETRVPDLTLGEKKQLCAERAFGGFGGFGGTVEFDGGTTIRFLSLEECVASFPTCDVELSELDFADLSRSHARDSLFNSPLECVERWLTGPLGNCHWGIEVRAAP
jgi:hypothetical protein